MNVLVGQAVVYTKNGRLAPHWRYYSACKSFVLMTINDENKNFNSKDNG